MFGLIDCNNFYVSCERVFRPDLNGKPVAVLSNNDGYIIAVSNEAKHLGVKRKPVFEFKEEIEKYNITLFSSNYTLYGDMSSRVMSILSQMVQNIEIYSIDEAFLDFEGHNNLETFGKEITHTVTKNTGIPVSLGIASTKTLAKIANKFAKKHKAYHNVCIIDNEEKRIKALQLTPIEDVWGIGRRIAKKLNLYGVTTAYEFTQQSQSWVRKMFTITGERTWKELKGIACIDIEEIPPQRKQICTSRSFGKMLTDYDNISEAIATHASSCANKLRKQKAFANSLMVFIHTNCFREDLPQHCQNIVIDLPVATNDSIEIVHYALQGLKHIFVEGFQYKKCGVIITEISNHSQGNLFDAVDRDKRDTLMQIIDKLNGRGSVIKLASQGNSKEWHLKQEQLSPRYTTNWSDVIEIKCR